MTDRIILTVPEDITSRARLIAETKAQSVEQILLEHLETLSAPLPEDEQTELEALHHLSDDALWAIARAQMADDVQARAHVLMDKNSRGLITDEEHAELGRLVERADSLMVRKAEAAAILKRRGYSFRQQDFKSQDE